MNPPRPHHPHALFAALALSIVTGTAAAATYTESIDGELSNDRLSPSLFVLDFSASGSVPGSNVLTGTLGRLAGTPPDRDYVTVRLPSGHVLASLRVGNQTTFGGGGAFIGFAAGSTMPVPETATSATGLLGWKVYGAADLNTDILQAMSVPANGSTGFSAPLAAGDYTFWLQELAAGTFDYRFNFVVAPATTVVPLPAAAWLFVAGMATLLAAGRRR